MSSNCCNNSSCTPTRVSLDYSGGEPLTYDTQTVEELVQYLKEGSVRGVDCVKSTGTGSNKLEDIDVKNWPDGSYAVALGYSIKGDGRGGLFRLDKSGSLGVGAQNDKDIFLAKGALDWYWLQIYNWTNKGIDCIVSTGTGDFKLESLDVKNFPHGFTQSVLGYHAAGDGGGGVFWLDKSGTLGAGAANGVTIFNALGGVNWYWRRSLEGSELLVEMGGAKGDGVTNDSAAISAVFALADTVDIGDKTYLIDTNLTLPANKTLRSKGGILSVGVGITLTVNAAVECEHVQLFSGAGTVKFGVDYRGDTKVAWFGNAYDDIGACINKWHICVNGVTGADGYSRRGILPAGILPLRTNVDLQRPKINGESCAVRLYGAGGVTWSVGDTGATVTQKGDGTYIDAQYLVSGDAITIGEVSAFPPYSDLGMIVELCNFDIVNNANGWGLVVRSAGARAKIDRVSAANNKNGMYLSELYGSDLGLLEAQYNKEIGMQLWGMNAVNIGQINIKYNGESDGGPWPAFVIGEAGEALSATGALFVGELYVEENYGPAAAIYYPTGVSFGAIYAEGNNASNTAARRGRYVWTVSVPDGVGSLNCGAWAVGAENGDNATYLLLDNGNANSPCVFDVKTFRFSGARNSPVGNASSINTATNVITINRHGLTTGDIVRFTGTNPPSPLVSGSFYEAIVINENSFSLETTNGEPVNLTTTGSGNDYRFATPKIKARGYWQVNLGVSLPWFDVSEMTLPSEFRIDTGVLRIGDFFFRGTCPAITPPVKYLDNASLDVLTKVVTSVAPVSFTPADINIANDRITIAGHGLLQNDVVLFNRSGGTTDPGNLSNFGAYYVIYIDANTIELSSSYDGSKIDITSTGDGTSYTLSKGYHAFGYEKAILCDATNSSVMTLVNNLMSRNAQIASRVAKIDASGNAVFVRDQTGIAINGGTPSITTQFGNITLYQTVAGSQAIGLP